MSTIPSGSVRWPTYGGPQVSRQDFLSHGKTSFSWQNSLSHGKTFWATVEEGLLQHTRSISEMVIPLCLLLYELALIENILRVLERFFKSSRLNDIAFRCVRNMRVSILVVRFLPETNRQMGTPSLLNIYSFCKLQPIV